LASSNFIDHVKIYCRSGAGGPGSRHFRRAKYVPNGGPDGGNGGRGAHIYLKGNAQMWTLLHLRYTKHIHADPGQGGMGQNMSGSQGKDVFLEVPLGTVAKDAETGEIIAEVVSDGQQVMLLEGGRGGMGNAHFKTATNQAPEYAQPGDPFKEKYIVLELKVLADVGLVGFPNAGKSTLLSVVSAAKPEIADYPFTTITPNLGVVQHRNYQSFIIADIPGIIEGAHEGKGIGHRFLRHIERNSVLLFMVPADSESITKEYKILVNELKEYNPELLDKPRALAISKTDLVTDAELKKLLKKVPKGIPVLPISAATQTGLSELKDLLWEILNQKSD